MNDGTERLLDSTSATPQEQIAILAELYSKRASAYDELWSPVIRPPAEKLLDELDDVSFNVSTRSALDAAKALFDEHSVPYGEVRELTAFGIAVLPFRDPDNIQLELSAPLA